MGSGHSRSSTRLSPPFGQGKENRRTNSLTLAHVLALLDCEGVGFPNLCSEKVLRESAQRNGGELVLNVKIEIFRTESRVNQVDQELYNKYARHFRVEPVSESPTALESKKDSKSGSIQNKVLLNMFRDKSFCDVSILCKTAEGDRKSIDVHKC